MTSDRDLIIAELRRAGLNGADLEALATATEELVHALDVDLGWVPDVHGATGDVLTVEAAADRLEQRLGE